MNKKIFGILSLILSLAPCLIIFFPAKNLDTVVMFVIAAMVCELLAIIFGFIGKKAAKGMSIAGIIIGIIMFIISIIVFAGFKLIMSAKDCVDNGNDTATCKLLDNDVEIPTRLLKDSQMK